MVGVHLAESVHVGYLLVGEGSKHASSSGYIFAYTFDVFEWNRKECYVRKLVFGAQPSKVSNEAIFIIVDDISAEDLEEISLFLDVYFLHEITHLQTVHPLF